MNINKSWKKNISRFLTAQTISLFGSSIVQYAAVWYITLTTSSGMMLTFSTICGFLPQILISLFAGVWIDRYPRKYIIMISDACIACSTLILLIIFLSGYKNVWFIIIILAIRSAGTGIQTPTVNAIIPQIVPIEQLTKINGINATLSSLSMFVSPALSGAILSLLSFEATLLIDIITAFIGITITYFIPISHVQSNNKESSQWNELKKGFQYLKQHLFIKKLMIFQFIILFLITPTAFLTPLYVARNFGNEVWKLTMSEMTYSLGMIVGGLIVSSWHRFPKHIRTTFIASTLYGLCMIGLGIAPTLLIYLIINTCIGMISPCYNTPITVLIQEKVEPNMLGRVFGFMQISSSCAFPIGMTLFGPFADYIPIPFLFVACGLIVIIISFFISKNKYINIKLTQ